MEFRNRDGLNEIEHAAVLVLVEKVMFADFIASPVHEHGLILSPATAVQFVRSISSCDMNGTWSPYERRYVACGGNVQLESPFISVRIVIEIAIWQTHTALRLK